MRSLLPALLTLLGITLVATSPARAADWGPWDTKTAPAQQTRDNLEPLDQAVRLFQKYISPIDGARCPMYPTCSAYSRQALRKHGPLLGVVMTADRLMHEGDPIEQQEPIIKWGYKRFYDPLAYNDFWLGKTEGRSQR